MVNNAISRPWSSTVPAALPAFVAMLQNRFAVLAPAVLIKDGPWISAESEEDIVAVGWSGFAPGYQYPSRSMSEELAAVDVSFENVAGGLAPTLTERISITCGALSRRAGTGQIPDARSAAFANVALVGQAIAPPYHTWNGTVTASTIATAGSLHQVADRRGVLAVVQFTVQATAFSQQ